MLIPKQTRNEMWMTYVDHVGNRRSPGTPETAYSNNTSVSRSYWMTGQVRQFGKGDRRGRQKLRVPTISLSINVGGEGGSCWMAG